MTRREWVKATVAAVLGATLFPWRDSLARSTKPLAKKGASLLEVPEGLEPFFVNSGPGYGRRIALTFDDGPCPGVTDVILRALERRNIQATFFMIGRRVQAAPSLGREVVAAGHEVGNHTLNHVPLSQYNSQRVYYEIARCQDIIEDQLRVSPHWFRPPYGAFRRNQGPIALSRYLGIAFWNVDPQDWRRPGVSKIINTVVSKTEPGSIILLHDIHEQTAEAVEPLLDELMDLEFTFTTMTRFLGLPYPIIPRAIPVSPDVPI
ncbi:MAG: polysaccharide deacetylase family protein [Methylacidiphilales bacterium]|nr:polysaccharide deacetylase family protein [Candidatus Methylacidiphilales bacterium]MDW8349654.1 polysaccharide deacetylase family protein [Verrucomicrobiae bacterium]